jgi:acyl dehydratase
MPDPTATALRHFDDLAIGETIELGSVTISRDMIIGFARQFDPLPFHLDEGAAKKSLLGGLAASGWQTAALSMRLLDEAWQLGLASRGSAAVSDLKWKKPVLVGDAITGNAAVTALTRTTGTDEGRAALSLDIVNQRGEAVMTLTLEVRVATRAAAASAA